MKHLKYAFKIVAVLLNAAFNTVNPFFVALFMGSELFGKIGTFYGIRIIFDNCFSF